MEGARRPLQYLPIWLGAANTRLGAANTRLLRDLPQNSIVPTTPALGGAMFNHIHGKSPRAPDGSTSGEPHQTFAGGGYAPSLPTSASSSDQHLLPSFSFQVA